MKLQLVRHLWGVDHTVGLQTHEAHWRDVGYECIEAAFHFSPDQDELIKLLKRGDWPWIAQVFSRNFDPGGSVEEHLQTLRKQIDDCLPYEPVFFNAHTGADSWSRNETEDFYGKVLELEKEVGIAIAHETHRLRPFGNPWTTRDILEKFPDLKLTVDLSHWVCVCERLLPDLGDIIALVAKHSHHLHTRVGHEQGSQVPDPRAPEWQGHLDAHEAWWDIIWNTQREQGREVSTLTPEFGPFPYMPMIPFKNEPIADLAEICDWVAVREAERFAK